MATLEHTGTMMETSLHFLDGPVGVENPAASEKADSRDGRLASSSPQMIIRDGRQNDSVLSRSKNRKKPPAIKKLPSD